MKRFIRPLLCATALIAMLCVPSFAAGTAVPISAPVTTGTAGNPAVLINGEAASFTDAAPKIMSGRTYIPFRAIFTALGFADDAILWDAETRTVTAENEDVLISMTIGETKVNVTRDGATTSFETDAAPLVDSSSNRTYVPVRFVAEAMDYRVGWDSTNYVVIIDDVAAILAANTETYELMDAYLEYNNQYSVGKWSAAGAYTMEMGIAGEKLAVNGDYTMLTENLALEFETAMSFSGTLDGTDVSTVIPTVNFTMLGDLESGALYFQSKELLEMMEMTPTDAWLKLDMAALLDSMSATTGLTYAGLMTDATASNASFADQVATMLETLSLESASFTTSDMLALINSMYGDSAFTQNGSDYTSQIDMDGVVISITFTTSNGAVTGYKMAIAMDVDGVAMDMTMSMSGANMDMSMYMSVSSAVDGVVYETYIDMTMDGTYTSTSSSPATKPPAGATVIDLMGLLGA